MKALPDSFVEDAVSVSGIPVLVERPLPMRDLLDGILEVQGELFMMRVAHAQPNTRVSQHAWHLGAKGSSVRVAMYGRSKRVGDGWAFFLRAQAVYLDLDYLAAEPSARCRARWASSGGSSSPQSWSPSPILRAWCPP